MIKRRRQAERTKASETAIFKAAVSIIAKEGPNKMTLAMVGKTAGFTGGLVSHRFGSKSGLLQAVSARIMEHWGSRALQDQRLLESSGIERLKLAVEFYWQDVRKGSDLMVAQIRLMQASYSSCPDLLPYFQELDQSLRTSIIDTISDDPNIQPDINLQTFAVFFIGTLRGISQQYYISKEYVDLDDAKLMIWKICDSLSKT